MSPFSLLLVLAVIQGLAEFLPISSSGHLVIAQRLLPGGAELSDGIGVEIMLHLGTLVAVLVHYRKRIQLLVRGIFGQGDSVVEQRSYLAKLVVATLPAVIAGLFVFDTDSYLFNSSTTAAYGLLFTAAVLFSARFASHGSTAISFYKAAAVGLAQAIAILPGISRSGSTIIAARHLKIAPQQAEDFSFIMAIPTIVGAAVLKLPDADFSTLAPLDLGCALMVSFVVGLFALKVVHKVVQKRKMYLFAPYCLLVAIFVLAST
ncbi:MAG: undecaprenyl-diphosphate phosphatase [Planctomycetes bacterium]|nr:undecaprenyl-diphosphate phosphatase [Planctomycetota bacterium]